MPVLKRAVPNEQGQMVLEFDGAEYRLFDTAILREERGWRQLAYPQHVKRFSLTPHTICWDAAGEVTAEFLYGRSQPLLAADLGRQLLRLGYQNQAPTVEHATHHVYAVFLARFSTQPFHVAESIGGGMGERGGSNQFTAEQLLAWPAWRAHFELSGCAWAIPLLESLPRHPQQVLDQMVSEASRRNGVA